MTSAITSGGFLGQAFYLAVLLWLAAEFIGALVVPLLRGSYSGTRTRADRGSRLTILAGIFIGIVIVNIAADLGWSTLSSGWVELGIVLILVGVGVRQYAIAVLGKFFNTSVRSLSDHRVISNGPYRWVRHPSYTGAILSLFGLALAGGSLEGLAAIGVLVVLTFGYRIRVEEAFLLEQLGKDYAEYRLRTKYLIPYVL